ncbi:MAG TPA: hypothetical protein DCO75_11190 [Fibrobacteres bacterium]|nr:hypothetical protein [Fibrobacterota bacterium]
MNAVFYRKNRLLICLLVNVLLAGCMSLQSHTSIEPYTKNKQLRNEVEIKAEEFCRAKRTVSSSAQPVKQPDYIYTTDGCSRWPDDSWLACCVVHDISYWCGGSDIDRKEADQELRRCVNNRTNIMGSIMYLGIRMGGAPWLPTPWRWGYGWNDWPREYENLDTSPSVKDLIKKLEIYETDEKHVSEEK